MPLEDFATPTHWIQDLDTRWPERIRMKASVVETLVKYLDTLHHPPRILELGIGDGELLEALMLRYSDAQFVAVDVNPTVLTFAAERLAEIPAVTFVQQDLRRVDWAPIIGANFDVIYSLQSFHDLGGYDALQAVYDQAIDRLKQRGLLLNADFVKPMPQDNPADPRRFPFPKHAALLQSLGASDVRLAHQYGQLGCIAAYAP